MVDQLHSFRTRLLALIIGVMAGTLGLVELQGLNNESRDLRLQLLDQAQRTIELQAKALSTPVWNLDSDEILTQLSALVAAEDFAAAVVLDETGTAIAEVEAQSRTSETLARSGEFHLAYEIRDETHEIIGQLRILVVNDRISALRAERIKDRLREFAIVSIVVAIVLSIAVTGLVRPVLRITDAMERLRDGELDVDIPATDRRDEIGKMARALRVFKSNAVQLRDSLLKERELNALQREFVAMVSHEFRTPMTIIDAAAQRVLRRIDRLDGEEVERRMQTIRGSVSRMSELVESTLSASRIEAGKIDFAPEPCSIARVVKAVCKRQQGISPDHDIEVSAEKLPDQVQGDPMLLGQVFTNLLSNAVKYAPHSKKIKVIGWTEDDCACVTVKDYGLGIPKSDMPRLFEKFFRASTSTGIKGTGIGLFLIRTFVELHDGTITARSELGKGSAFTVRLPISGPKVSASEDAVQEKTQVEETTNVSPVEGMSVSRVPANTTA